MKNKKQQLQSDCEKYETIIRSAESSVHREDIYEKMAPSIKRWIVDNVDYAARAWFERIEQTVLKQQDNLNQSEFHFALNPDAIVALGDSQRIRLGCCDADLCIVRRNLISENRDRQMAAAEREIAALDDAISQLKDGQTVDDILG